MRLYFVRHGESEANVAREFSNQRHEKHPLTEKGRAQVQALAEKLRDVQFGAIYASPLLRARQTAEILNGGRALDIQVTPALREHDAGELEGRADESAWEQYSELFKRWGDQNDLDARIAGGESFNDLQSRFYPFVESLVKTYGDTDTNILIVAHGGVFHFMLPVLLVNIDHAFGRKHLLGNTAVVIAEYINQALVCVLWDGIDLMPEESVKHEI